MALDIRFQKDLFVEMDLRESRVPKADKERIKALLGELIVSVFEAEEDAIERKEAGDE